MPGARILTIANSRKLGGYCVAGVSLPDRRLVRPVSPYGNGALSARECRVRGRGPRLLDVVSFEHTGPAEDPAQPENLVIADTPWQLAGGASSDRALEILLGVVHAGPTLLVNHGRAVPAHVAAAGLKASLALIEPVDLRFGHGPRADAHTGSPRALFRFGGRAWNLPITDFDIGPKLLRLPEGLHGWADLGLNRPKCTLLTISLGAAHKGWHHKLVAAVLRFG
ncbi:MAG TPA: hypothetical protein VNR42_11855 [Solirubrobacteraceae bacterium]|nr:hypothetical protein [Solirubrobacteraceae bacterium]